MKTLPVAVQLYSIREEAQANPEAALAAVREMGYDGVEFAGLWGLSPEQIRALCQKYNLTPISAHVPLDDMAADPEGVIGTYAAVGVRYIAVPYLQEDRRPGTPGWEKTICDIKRCAQAARAAGIQMLYHNHDFEFVKIDGEYALDILYNTVCPELLATEIDTCWVNVAGEKPADYIRKYTGRSPVVHLKDFFKAEGKTEGMYELIGIKPEGETASEESFGFRPLGAGLQNIPEILEASVDAGAGWVVVEQDRPAPGMTPMESIRQSRDYLKSLGW